MALRRDSMESRKRILSACVKLFIEKGYNSTTMAEIVSEANVSNSTFQNLFRSKSGVLMDLVEFMFRNQFGITRKIVDEDEIPALVYAVETAIQMTLTELNENLREIYVEAYTNAATADYIAQKTSAELYKIFGVYMPECSESDFYELDIGTGGMMRGYMERPCDQYFTLEKKLERFLTMTLKTYCVPEKECSCDDGRCEEPDPCQVFRQVQFPMEEFFPPNALPTPPSGYREVRACCR